MIDVKYYFEDIADPRAKDLWFMSCPLFPIGTILLYLFLIFIFIPNYMKNRPAFQLKLILRLYNLFQVVICFIQVYGVATSYIYTFECVNTDYSNKPNALRMLYYVWLTMIIKLIDLLDTIFFLLRKKNNQVTFLHIYHHITTFLFAWVSTKYFAGGTWTVFILINGSIHVIMYFYYFLSSFGSNMQKKLAVWKPRLTMIQIIQFPIIIGISTYGLIYCDLVIKYLCISFIPNVYLLLRMFVDFYKKNYLKTKSS